LNVNCIIDSNTGNVKWPEEFPPSAPGPGDGNPYAHIDECEKE